MSCHTSIDVEGSEQISAMVLGLVNTNLSTFDRYLPDLMSVMQRIRPRLMR